MSEKLKRCKACDETFVWNDDVILVNDEIYHKDCVISNRILRNVR